MVSHNLKDIQKRTKKRKERKDVKKDSKMISSSA
jgi:hypothetical protein